MFGSNDTSSERMARKRLLSKTSRKALSLIADEKRKGHVTDRHAMALQRYLVSLYGSEYFQTELELSLEEFVGYTQQRLERRFDDLLEHILQLE